MPPDPQLFSDIPRMPPDSDDVIAACRFLEVIDRAPRAATESLLIETIRMTRRVFVAWYATLDLGSEEAV
jgi:hypothetical protein